jgi:hypothetical protein
MPFTSDTVGPRWPGARLLRQARTIAAAALALNLSGCIAPTPAYPLYRETAPPLGPRQIAQLRGYVRLVDGRDVSGHGAAFELLPGCHLVGTPSLWSRGGDKGATVMNTGELTFALPMRAGYRYLVEAGIGQAYRSGAVGHGGVVAYELDAGGNTTRTFAPAAGPQDLGCQGAQGGIAK